MKSLINIDDILSLLYRLISSIINKSQLFLIVVVLSTNNSSLFL